MKNLLFIVIFFILVSPKLYSAKDIVMGECLVGASSKVGSLELSWFDGKKYTETECLREGYNRFIKDAIYSCTKKINSSKILYREIRWKPKNSWQSIAKIPCKEEVSWFGPIKQKISNFFLSFFAEKAKCEVSITFAHLIHGSVLNKLESEIKFTKKECLLKKSQFSNYSCGKKVMIGVSVGRQSIVWGEGKQRVLLFDNQCNMKKGKK